MSVSRFYIYDFIRVASFLLPPPVSEQREVVHFAVIFNFDWFLGSLAETTTLEVKVWKIVVLILCLCWFLEPFVIVQFVRGEGAMVRIQNSAGSCSPCSSFEF